MKRWGGRKSKEKYARIRSLWHSFMNLNTRRTGTYIILARLKRIRQVFLHEAILHVTFYGSWLQLGKSARSDQEWTKMHSLVDELFCLECQMTNVENFVCLVEQRQMRIHKTIRLFRFVFEFSFFVILSRFSHDKEHPDSHSPMTKHNEFVFCSFESLTIVSGIVLHVHIVANVCDAFLFVLIE